MVYSVRFTKDALNDLQAIEAYLTERDPAAAGNVIRQIKQSSDLLRYFPFLGVPARTRDVRLLLVKQFRYVLPYKIVGNDIFIIGVLHPRQRNPHR